MDDVELTFDPEMFKKGLVSILDSLGRIETKLGDVTGATNKMEKSGAKSIGMWTALMTKGLALITGAAHRIMGFMPEIGHSIQVAGDIIGRNLLWPLRQQLIPVLQSMLNWVRDHRAMFVRWGMVIANIFRVVKMIAMNFFQSLKKVWEAISSGIKKLFGGTAKTITEILNILLFRWTVLAIAAQAIIEPIVDFFIKVFKQVVSLSRTFIEGFLSGVRGISEPIEDIVNAFKDFLSMIGDITEGMPKLSGAFKLLGNVLGTSVKMSLEAIALFLDTVVTGLKEIPLLIRLIKNVNKGMAWEDAFEDFKKGQQEVGVKFIERQKRRFERVDESVKETGNIIQKEFLTPPENKSNRTVNNNTNITAPINVIDHTGNTKKTAEDIQRHLVNEVKKDMNKKGMNIPGKP